MKEISILKKGKNKIKLNKKQKIIISLTGIGAVLGLSLGISLPLLSKGEINHDKKIVAKIKAKIKNKVFKIPKNVNTFSDLEILLAIKNQLKIQNDSLNNEDLLKITDNIWHLKPGKKTSVILRIKSNNETDTVNINVTKEKDVKLWTKNSAIVANSNILDGRFSSFIQDSSGNLWAMGAKGDGDFVSKTTLQVLKRDGTQWENNKENGLTKGSNISDGTKGFLFEDDFGNLWAMGAGTKLQVLVKNKDGTFVDSWTNDNTQGGEKLLQGSKITDGTGGIIFQDSFGNLWAMAKGSKLQVLLKNKNGSYASSWETNNTQDGQLLKNSNITSGYWGTIFQDEFKNLWAMGEGTKLQVLKVKPNGFYEDSWTNNNNEDLLKNSQVNDGEGGVIFQDSFGNLWIMSNNSKLQVLIKKEGGSYASSWDSNNANNAKGLLNNSNIADGWKGVIFQDSFGNLWTSGYGKKQPQVLAKSKNGAYVSSWTNDNTQAGLLNNLQSYNPNKLGVNLNWTFFQDSFKNLWAMGNGTKLQLLKVNQSGDGYEASWKDNKNQEELLTDSNLVSGQGGTIFEDSSKNLWTIGYRDKLQVYDKTQKKWIS